MNADASGEYCKRSVETNGSFSENVFGDALWRGDACLFLEIFFRQRHSTSVMLIPVLINNSSVTLLYEYVNGILCYL